MAVSFRLCYLIGQPPSSGKEREIHTLQNIARKVLPQPQMNVALDDGEAERQRFLFEHEQREGVSCGS